MDAHMLNTIANFIWGIADDCLRDVYVRGKYRDVILPMTVIRHLDAVLEDTKQFFSFLPARSDQPSDGTEVEGRLRGMPRRFLSECARDSGEV